MPNKFIIYSSEFDENIGGPIVLHRLCHILNIEGQQAYLWPFDKPRIPNWRDWNWRPPIILIIKYLAYLLRSKKYKVNDNFTTPVANYSDLKSAIAIYPEIISGNPLYAKKVVRWFLHKPGFHTGEINYSNNELYFFIQQAFNDETLNPNSDNLLQAVFVRDDVYFQTNFSERTGSCYILKKGRNRELIHDTKKSILIDDLTHKEIAKIFNSVETCISYDLYTMYSHYAALCGCISIVIPEEGLTKDEWRPEEHRRYGIAYGFDDIQHAKDTQKHVLPMLKKLETDANNTVKKFIKKCELYF